MALTFIDLTNKLLRKLNEAEVGSSQFASVRGFHASAKDFINYAIQDIDTAEYYWPFNHQEHSLTLTPGTQKYSLPTNYRVVDWLTAYIERNDSINVLADNLEYMTYDMWAEDRRITDKNTTQQGRGKPRFIVSTDDDSLIVSPVPDKAYTVKFQYWGKEAELENRNDTTNIPDRFQHIIIERALWWSYMFRADPQAASLIHEKYKDSLRDMRAQLINRYDTVYSGMR